MPCGENRMASGLSGVFHTPALTALSTDVRAAQEAFDVIWTPSYLLSGSSLRCTWSHQLVTRLYHHTLCSAPRCEKSAWSSWKPVSSNRNTPDSWTSTSQRWMASWRKSRTIPLLVCFSAKARTTSWQSILSRTWASPSASVPTKSPAACQKNWNASCHLWRTFRSTLVNVIMEIHLSFMKDCAQKLIMFSI